MLVLFHYKSISISIHSLRMEGDLTRADSPIISLYFNPLPPHGGRLLSSTNPVIVLVISIHSLRMEGDLQIVVFSMVT